MVELRGIAEVLEPDDSGRSRQRRVLLEALVKVTVEDAPIQRPTGGLAAAGPQPADLGDGGRVAGLIARRSRPNSNVRPSAYAPARAGRPARLHRTGRAASSVRRHR